MAIIRYTVDMRLNGKQLPGFPLQNQVSAPEYQEIDSVYPTTDLQEPKFGVSPSVVALHFEGQTSMDFGGGTQLYVVVLEPESLAMLTSGASSYSYSPASGKRVQGIA